MTARGRAIEAMPCLVLSIVIGLAGGLSGLGCRVMSDELHKAAEANDLELAKELLSKGKDVNALYSFSESSRHGGGSSGSYRPLHLATGKGHVRMVEFLLESGADPNLSNNDGMTPLHFASCKGFVPIVKALLSKGAKANLADPEGMTALHFAAINGYFDVVKLLVEKGADVNLEISQKRMFAIINPGSVVGGVTLQAGATAAEAAREADCMGIAKYLGRQQKPPYFPQRKRINKELEKRRRGVIRIRRR